MSDLLQRLKPRERRGSKPRCHLLTHGSTDEVAARLSSLAAPFVRVSAGDRWMPQGFDVREAAAQLPDEAEEPKSLDEVDALEDGGEEAGEADLDATSEEAVA